LNIIFISLTDIVHVIKKKRLLLYLSGFFFASAAFLYLVSKPICFTANGIFNGNLPIVSTPLVKALEFLGKEENTLFSSEQRSLLSSTPVLEGVIRALHLQATLTEKQIGRRCSTIWYNLKTAKTYRHLQKQKVPSQILSGDVYTPFHLVIPDIKQPVTCSAIDFSSETALSLKIFFLDAKTFQVYLGKKKLGVGTLDIPFTFSEGSFTLSGKSKKGKAMGLHLIPLNVATESLKKSLRITKNKDNNFLIDISSTHQNRHLAAQIVNEVMEQIQSYLVVEGKKKIKKQMHYLQQRQEETMEYLDDILQKQKANLESDLNSGIIVTLEKELEYMVEQQAQKKEELLQIHSEMEYLSQIVQPFADPVEKSAKNIRSALTVEAARDLICEHQHQLDLIYLNCGKYAYCLSKLSECEFDSSSLCHILSDPSLSDRFAIMRNLHHRLIDEKNWTGKEREQLKEELETEKQFLVQYIHHLKEGTELHEKILNERILSLQQDLLYLLSDLYRQTESTLNDLRNQAAHFPQKWLNDQKIEIHTKLYTDMMESIAKMVEAKNIGYHIDYLMSNSFQKAIPPVLPNNPKLLSNTFLGGAAGVLVAFLGLSMYQVWIGPSASFENLSAQGRNIIPRHESIKRLGLVISQGGKLVLLTSQEKSMLSLPLMDWLAKRGEKVFLIDLSGHQLPDFMEEGEAFLTSIRFQQFLHSLKETYDRTIIISKRAPQSVETQILCSYADSIVYSVVHERLSDCQTLPRQTWFFIQDEKEKMLSLGAITPLLTKLLKDAKNSSRL